MTVPGRIVVRAVPKAELVRASLSAMPSLSVRCWAAARRFHHRDWRWIFVNLPIGARHRFGDAVHSD
jgi:hypothetical protein